MPDIPGAALDAAERAIIEAATDFGQDNIVAGPSCDLARAALEAAAPILADQIASAILRHADEHEPDPGSAGYLAWHRHFDAASAVAARAFGRGGRDVAKLNETAEATLRDAGVSQAAWARANYMPGGKWHGDVCGCPDDRCANGFHHAGEDDCGCLDVLLESYLARPDRPAAERG